MYMSSQENSCKLKELTCTRPVSAYDKKKNKQLTFGESLAHACLARCTFPALAHSALIQPYEIGTITMPIF